MRLSDISEAQASLLATCQDLYFGAILDLHVRGGQPVLDPRPRVIREIKLGTDSGPAPQAPLGDYALKDQQIELVKALAEIGNGVIDRLEIKNGLPFRLIVAEQA